MLKKFVDTNGNYSALALRLALGAVIFPHGAQKLLGWFGGPGYAGTMEFFTQTMGIPAPLAFLVIAIEFFGPIALVAGMLSRVVALAIGVVMVAAVLMVHLPNGFFMNWYGAQAGEGFEFHILAIGISIAVLIQGSGGLSLDRRIYDSIRRGY